MRYQGKITTWKDEQGYGFITPNAGGKQVFIHIKSFAQGKKHPFGNELVTYQLITDGKDRLSAGKVLYAGYLKHKPLTIGKSAFPIYFALAFIVLMCLAVIVGTLSSFVLFIYATTSLLTFMLYWGDKRAAENGGHRTPEKTLQLLSLAGGWPGGLFAQRTFRHKSTKKSFQATYWATVLLNLIGLFTLGSPAMMKLLRSLLNIGS